MEYPKIRIEIELDGESLERIRKELEKELIEASKYMPEIADMIKHFIDESVYKVETSKPDFYTPYDLKKAEDMLKVDYAIPVAVIGGLGPQYDDACLVMMLRFWKYFDEHEDAFKEVLERGVSEEIGKELDKLVEDIEPTGAMFDASLRHAVYIKKNGYKDWISKANKIVMWKPHIDYENKES